MKGNVILYLLAFQSAQIHAVVHIRMPNSQCWLVERAALPTQSTNAANFDLVFIFPVDDA